jgi:hypothetical protein
MSAKSFSDALASLLTIGIIVVVVGLVWKQP